MEQKKLDLSFKQFKQFVDNGATIVDTRQFERYLNEYIPGSYNVALTDVFESWMSKLFTPETPIVLICDRDTERTTMKRLDNLGFQRNILGYLVNGVEEYKAHMDLVKYPTRQQPDLTEQEFAQFYFASDPNSYQVLDVRTDEEVKRNGNVQGSLNVNVFELENKIKENIEFLDKNKAYYIHCKSGWKACLAISILAKYGFLNSARIGGFEKLKNAGVPTNDPLKRTIDPVVRSTR